MQPTAMTYNTQKDKLKMPEYGRAVQDMIQHAIQLPTKEERTQCAYTIIDMMCNMQEEDDSQPNLEQRVWDHLAFISNYQLDINYPFPITRLDGEGIKPQHIPYPTHKIEHPQYGHLVEEGLKKLEEMPEGEERDELTRLLANQMKLSLYNWNKDAMSNEKVAADIYEYTHGKVQLDLETFQWNAVQTLPRTDGLKKKKRK